MGEAVLTYTPRPGSFREAFEHFCRARREVLLNDVRAAFLADENPLKKMPSQWRVAVTQLKEFDRFRELRVRGRGRWNFFLPVQKAGAYSGMFRRLDRICRSGRWNPALPEAGPVLRHPPFRLRRKSPDCIVLTHSHPADVPRILGHCEELWDRALSCRSIDEAAQAIAEFEWWFFAANPTGPCGASLGACLSLALQRSAGIPIPRRFRHWDWASLSRDLGEYRKWRRSAASG